MAKIDISTSRSLTINTGSYESVKPTVTLTLKDVDTNKASDAYVTMSKILDGLMKIEIMESTKEFDNIKNSGGIKSYCRTVSDNISTIGQKIDDSFKEIDKYLC